MKAGDKITGRIFGQDITLQRCEWRDLAAGDPDILARARQIASYPADQRAESGSRTRAAVPADASPITGREADALFAVAIDGAEADEVRDCGSWRSMDGRTFTRTAGLYGDGQSAQGVHVRDADGEFVEFVHDAPTSEADSFAPALNGGQYGGGSI